MQSKGNTDQGFTLAELLVTMGIVLLVMAAAYQGYTRLLQGFEMESSSAEAQMEDMVNVNLLRQDILHSGFGLPRNVNEWPLEWEDGELTIRSTVNNLDQDTKQWALCSDNGTNMNPELDPGTDHEFVILDRDGNHHDNLDGCPSNQPGIFFAYPYNSSLGNACGASDDPFCYETTYSLQSQSMEGCAQGTEILQRFVSNNGQDLPIMNCVADWQVVFELDNNDRISDFDAEFSNPEDIRDRLKMIHVYVLAQEGGYKEDFDFSQEYSLQGVEETLSLEDVPDYSNYRWNMINFSIQPKDL